MHSPEELKKMQEDVVQQSLVDPDYRARLIDDPRGALAERGVDLPQSVNLVVVEDTEDKLHMVLPALPVEGPLSDADIEAIAAGGSNTVPCADSDWL